MSTRNLDALFKPKAIALIGASNKPGSVGAVLSRNLLQASFDGRVFPVNPHETSICGATAYSDIEALPQTPDLAVIATPAPTIPKLIDDLGRRGCRAAIIISAGEGLRDAVLPLARPYLMRIVGPNCLGMLSPVRGINASFAHLHPNKGGIALLTQSGAVATSMLDWATGRGIGFSHILSLGDMSDVDFGDLLDYLALDPATQSILLYIEGVTQARKFMSAARIAARLKPVLVVKGGRSATGAQAVASHTGALAGADAVYDAAFRRAGMLRVETLRDLFDAAETLASGVRIHGDRLTIVTNGGGLGVLAADALEAGGGHLAPLSPDTIAALDAVLPRGWSRRNPIDIMGDAQPDRYRRALDVLSAQGQQDAILAMNCPTGVADSAENTAPVIDMRASHPDTPVLACWMGDATATAARDQLFRAQIPSYETPDEAIKAYLHLVEYGRNQSALLETPAPAVAHDENSRLIAHKVISGALTQKRTLLSEMEAKEVLAAYGVPVVKTLQANSLHDARAAAMKIVGPIALKILSRDISHKSDVGGVKLNIQSPEQVEAAAAAMIEAVKAAAPNASLDGFTVEEMVHRPGAQELIVGASIDPVFGPVILFGHGGVAVEVISDRSIGLAPLNSALAQDMIKRTRVAKLLAGYRDRPRADIEAITKVLVAVSDLLCDFPQIKELDINPLLADANGVIALDARIILNSSDEAARTPLSIRPYPSSLEKEISLPNGQDLTLRPVRPDDAALLTELVQHCDPRDGQIRIRGAVQRLDEGAVARLTQIDYDREMVLIALTPDGCLAAAGKLEFDPDFTSAEYALIIASKWQELGLGRSVLLAMLSYARIRGAHIVWGDEFTNNEVMITLACELGAAPSPMPSSPETTRLTFSVTEQDVKGVQPLT